LRLYGFKSDWDIGIEGLLLNGFKIDRIGNPFILITL